MKADFKTNYSVAWLNYRRTTEYKDASNALKSAGIKQPYRNNILQNAFTAGWGKQKIYQVL